MKLKIEKVSNMIMVSEVETDVVFMAWDEEEFTERKLNNFTKKMNRMYIDGVEIINVL